MDRPPRWKSIPNKNTPRCDFRKRKKELVAPTIKKETPSSFKKIILHFVQMGSCWSTSHAVVEPVTKSANAKPTHRRLPTGFVVRKDPPKPTPASTKPNASRPDRSRETGAQDSSLVLLWEPHQTSLAAALWASTDDSPPSRHSSSHCEPSHHTSYTHCEPSHDYGNHYSSYDTSGGGCTDYGGSGGGGSTWSD